MMRRDGFAAPPVTMVPLQMSWYTPATEKVKAPAATPEMNEPDVPATASAAQPAMVVNVAVARLVPAVEANDMYAPLVPPPGSLAAGSRPLEMFAALVASTFGTLFRARSVFTVAGVAHAPAPA